MSINIKSIFTPSAAISAIEAQFELRWAKFLAKARAAGDAVLETMKDIGLLTAMDPSDNLSGEALLQQARIGVLFLIDLLGLDYVAEQLVKRPKVLLLTAVHALHDLKLWERVPGDNREEVVISNYLVLAAKASVTLQGLDIESEEGKEAYTLALRELADEEGVERIYVEVDTTDWRTTHDTPAVSDELPPPPAEVVVEEVEVTETVVVVETTAAETVEQQEPAADDTTDVEDENAGGAEDDVEGSDNGEDADADADGEDKA